MFRVDLQKIDQENFIITEQKIGGDHCFLVYPKKQFYQWTKELLPFRSAIFNEQGEAVSLSFKKFFNWGERSELTYTPFSFKANGGARALEKKDGSTLLFSKYKGQLIRRTRGTFDVSALSNSYEVDLLMQKYPRIAEYFSDQETVRHTLAFEWMSPTNKIVVPVTEPELYLLTVIDHRDYSMMQQSDVDTIAKSLGVPRPQRFEFKSIKDMLTQVETMKDFEGLCVYCNHDQDIRKIKTEWYLKMHRALTDEFGSFEKVVEFYFANGMPEKYQDFYDIVVRLRDYEVAEALRGEISRVIDGMKEVRKIHKSFVEYVGELRKIATRKEMAEKVFASHGKTNRADMIFLLYDGKELNSENYKKLFWQAVKK